MYTGKNKNDTCRKYGIINKTDMNLLKVYDII